jgi:hypothetical protein
MAHKNDQSKNNVSSEALKELLAHELGGEAADWKRGPKKEYGGEILRKFENKKLDLKIDLWERPDGLLCAEKPDGSLITARLTASGDFNAAAKPSAIDQVMNAMYETKDVDPALYKQAVRDGLAKNFSFVVVKFGEDGGEAGEPMAAMIYPTTKDSTFKAPEIIEPMIPGVDGVDSCVVTEYILPQQFDTPGKVVKHLSAQGFVWDVASQKEDKPVYDEIQAELSGRPALPKPRHPKR